MKEEHESEKTKDISEEGSNKKTIIKKIFLSIITIILIIILIFLFKGVLKKHNTKKFFENSILSFAEKNEKIIFSINKIIFFSSSDSKNKSSSISNFTIENLYTYTDIALFIDNNSEENTLENTLKKVKIDNIKITQAPTVGEPNLYYKSINNFAKSELEENNRIKDTLEFNISSEDETDLSKPTLYNNCANPITLSYINQNVKTDYTILDTSNPITYNGTLLKRCGVALSSIQSSISFDIYIENNKNEKFKTSIYINIPYEDGEKSIYDGNLTLKQDTNFNFYRYE